jgi:hypothetical protein
VGALGPAALVMQIQASLTPPRVPLTPGPAPRGGCGGGGEGRRKPTTVLGDSALYQKTGPEWFIRWSHR